MPNHEHKGNQLEWSYANITRIPRNIKGVYVIWCPDLMKQIYVGKAERRPIQTRLLEHWQQSHNPTLRWWIKEFGHKLSICYYHCPQHRIAELEKRLINTLNPEANGGN